MYRGLQIKQLHSRHSSSRSGQPDRNRNTNDIAKVMEIVGSRWSIDLSNSHKQKRNSGRSVKSRMQSAFTANHIKLGHCSTDPIQFD